MEERSIAHRNLFNIEELADEIILLILSYLSPESLANVSQVSKRFKNLANDNFLWRVIGQKYFGLFFCPKKSSQNIKNDVRALFGKEQEQKILISSQQKQDIIKYGLSYFSLDEDSSFRKTLNYQNHFHHLANLRDALGENSKETVKLIYDHITGEKKYPELNVSEKMLLAFYLDQSSAFEKFYLASFESPAEKPKFALEIEKILLYNALALKKHDAAGFLLDRRKGREEIFDFDSCLNIAICSKDIRISELLFDKAPDGVLAEKHLLSAAKEGDTEIIQCLLDRASAEVKKSFRAVLEERDTGSWSREVLDFLAEHMGIHRNTANKRRCLVS